MPYIEEHKQLIQRLKWAYTYGHNEINNEVILTEAGQGCPTSLWDYMKMQYNMGDSFF